MFLNAWTVFPFKISVKVGSVIGVDKVVVVAKLVVAVLGIVVLVVVVEMMSVDVVGGEEVVIVVLLVVIVLVVPVISSILALLIDKGFASIGGIVFCSTYKKTYIYHQVVEKFVARHL